MIRDDAAGWRGAALLISTLMVLSSRGSARADGFSVEGHSGTGVTADIYIAYQVLGPAEATLTLVATNTTGDSGGVNGAITGLALNLPASVGAIGDFSFTSDDKGAKQFSAYMLPDGIRAGSFGVFDLGITNAKVKIEQGRSKKNRKGRKPPRHEKSGNEGGEKSKASSSSDYSSIDGGKAKTGIDPGFTGTFAIGLTGTDLDLLNVSSFLQALSRGGGDRKPGFVLRLQGVGEEARGSDFATINGSNPPAPVPESASSLLLGAGLAVLARSRRRG